MRSLIAVLCSDENPFRPQSSAKYFGWMQGHSHPELHEMLSSRISTKRFLSMMEHPQVRDLLE